MREREGLIARIRQIRRTAVTPSAAPPKAEPGDDSTALSALETRVRELEELVQALQDSVHRESQRHEKMIADLDARTQPAALGVALMKDARERGL